MVYSNLVSFMSAEFDKIICWPSTDGKVKFTSQVVTWPASTGNSLFADKEHKGENMGSRLFMALHKPWLNRVTSIHSYLWLCLAIIASWLQWNSKPIFFQFILYFMCNSVHIFNQFGMVSIQCRFNLMPI